jgi:hypothetical protein
MTKRRTLIAATVTAVALAAGGAFAAASGSGDEAPQPRYGTAGLPEDLSPDQRKAVDAVLSDAPIPVQDAHGTPRGFVRDSALTARDERVTAIVLARFREPEGPVDEEYEEVFEALRILDPVPVVDAEGTTVGYWTHDFKEIDELRELEPGARAVVERELRP